MNSNIKSNINKIDINYNDKINSLKRRLYYISDKNQLNIRINYLNFVIDLLNENIDKNILNTINKSKLLLLKIVNTLSIPENQKLLYNNIKTIYNNNLNLYNSHVNNYNTFLKNYNNKIITELDLLYKIYSDPLTPKTSIDNNLKINVIKFLLDFLKQNSNLDIKKIDPIDIFSKYYYINIKDYIKYMNEETFYIILNNIIKNNIPEIINNLDLLTFQLTKYPITDIKFEFTNLLSLYTNPVLLNHLKKNINNEIDMTYKLYQSSNCLNNSCYTQLLNLFNNEFLKNDKFKNVMINNFNKQTKKPTYVFKFSNSKLMDSISKNCENCLLRDITIVLDKEKKIIEIIEIKDNLILNRSIIKNITIPINNRKHKIFSLNNNTDIF